MPRIGGHMSDQLPINIPDNTVFNVESNWYKSAVALFNKCASQHYATGHQHHWLPCAIIAEILFKKKRPANYRDIVDEKYPQKLVRMPVNAHILIHYYIWRAVHQRFKSKMEYAFAKLCGMKDPNGAFFEELDRCLKTGKPAKIFQGEKAKRIPDTPALKEIPMGISINTARKLCSEAWKEYKGPNAWPKFQHDYMRQFRPIWKLQRKNRKKNKNTARHARKIS